MGNSPSTESEIRRRARADEAAATQAVSQPAYAIAENQAARNATQNAIVDEVTHEVQKMFEHRSCAQTHVKAGFAAEYHHEASYNVSAVEQGSDFRCLVVDNDSNNKTADLKIFNRHKPFATVQEVQIKTGAKDYVYKSLKHAKYDTMQKVVPKGLENPAKGFDSKVKFEKASSTPLSNEGAYNIVKDPTKHFDDMRPAVQDASNAGLTVLSSHRWSCWSSNLLRLNSCNSCKQRKNRERRFRPYS